jgi:hypothetical protein
MVQISENPRTSPFCASLPICLHAAADWMITSHSSLLSLSLHPRSRLFLSLVHRCGSRERERQRDNAMISWLLTVHLSFHARSLVSQGKLDIYLLDSGIPGAVIMNGQNQSSYDMISSPSNMAFTIFLTYLCVD